MSSKPFGDDGGGMATGGGDARTSRAPPKKNAWPFSCARASSLGSKTGGSWRTGVCHATGRADDVAAFVVLLDMVVRVDLRDMVEKRVV